ncbi:MAG TPA: hypothetical protein VL443_24420 [Cyclobacteriaceae bacterium]|jgi:hypothetical protein|nr:hypothetical protein [Cyclobacteriaceae bacterium]
MSNKKKSPKKVAKKKPIVKSSKSKTATTLDSTPENPSPIPPHK